jgi:hypothetical protein
VKERWAKILAVCVTVYIILGTAGAAPARAQEFRATIVGRVTDTSGAVVPGARVSATNTQTGIVTRTVTTDTGDYVLPNLPPGPYRLEVEHTGFKKYVREGIVLQILDRPSIDVVLEPGEITTAITVSAEASRLETATASRGTVILGRTLEDMPLNARNAFELAGLAPGVQFTARGKASTLLRVTANAGTSSMAMAGGQPRYNEALLDGVPITGSDGLIQYVPSLDATQEFKVQTNVFDAEFGRFTGGVINAVAKSGSNEVHGTLWEFLRNSALNARDPFATTQPQFGYNQFGGTIGGPVWLPGLYRGKDRTFFFFNYEGSREGVPRAFVSTVPVEAQRRGDFSDTYVVAAGQLRPVIIYDPATTRQLGASFVRDPFPGNRIPADRIHPVGQNLVGLYPLPNAPGVPGTQANNYLRSFKDPVFDNGYLIRMDHRLSDRHQIYWRYSWRHFRVTRQGAFKNEVTGDAEDRWSPGFAFDDTYTISPTLVYNLRLGVARYVSRSASFNLGFDPAKLGFPASFGAGLPVRAIPQISVSGFTTLSGMNKLQRNVEDSYYLRSALTKVFGRHSFRAGGEVRVLRSYPGSAGAAAAGAFSFDNLFTRGPNPQATAVDRGYGLASLLLGLPSSGSVVNNAFTAEQAPYYGIYVQDDIRLTSRLTINLGLRYEWEGENTERFNRFNRGFAFDVPSPLEEKARANYAANPIPEVPPAQFRVRGGLLFAGVGGAPRGITNVDRDNWAPRIGAAYLLTRRTVLRGGYGIFYGATTLMTETRLGFSATTPFVASIDGGLTPYNTLTNPFPQGILPPPGAKEGLLTLVGQGISFVYLDRQQPLAHQYQFSVQRELPWQVLVEAAYVGSAGRESPVSRQIDPIPLEAVLRARETFVATGRNILNDSVSNPFYGLIASGALSARTTTRGQLLRPYPHFTSIVQADESIGWSRYDAFQLKVEKRFSSGVSFMASYTAAKQLERSRFLNDQDNQPVKELASFDIPQRLVISGTWELPFGPGRKWLATGSRLVRKLAEGWQLNGIYTAQGGIPLTVSGAESLGRSARLPADQRTINRWFDTTVFRQRQTLELVGLSRLPDVRSMGKNNMDLSLFKTVRLTENLRVQFRTEAFNALNRPEYSEPNTTFGNPNFGVITSTNTYTRQIQFGLKLLW